MTLISEDLVRFCVICVRFFLLVQKRGNFSPPDGVDSTIEWLVFASLLEMERGATFVMVLQHPEGHDCLLGETWIYYSGYELNTIERV